jgi:hypothetical protein
MKQLGRTVHVREDNIKMDLEEIALGVCGFDLSGSGNRLVSGFCEHCTEPSGSIKDGEFHDYLSVLLRITQLHGVS